LVRSSFGSGSGSSFRLVLRLVWFSSAAFPLVTAVWFGSRYTPVGFGWNLPGSSFGSGSCGSTAPRARTRTACLVGLCATWLVTGLFPSAFYVLFGWFVLCSFSSDSLVVLGWLRCITCWLVLVLVRSSSVPVGSVPARLRVVRRSFGSAGSFGSGSPLLPVLLRFTAALPGFVVCLPLPRVLPGRTTPRAFTFLPTALLLHAAASGSATRFAVTPLRLFLCCIRFLRSFGLVRSRFVTLVPVCAFLVAFLTAATLPPNAYTRSGSGSLLLSVWCTFCSCTVLFGSCGSSRWLLDAVGSCSFWFTVPGSVRSGLVTTLPVPQLVLRFTFLAGSTVRRVRSVCWFFSSSSLVWFCCCWFASYVD